ncbi:phosphotransferase [Paracoccus marcusii]|uniref:phosphotransferase n=1 Tax=Paracoccus marcusii TaxID=59779 RepID=UPI0039C87537
MVYGISLPNKINNEGGIPENLLLTETSTGWKLAAVIDFGDVMTGWREYDLLGPSTFMCAGVPAACSHSLKAMV